MGIFLFITFFFSDLIVIVACGYEYKKHNQYKDGMILGVHIPKEALEHEEVQRICERERRQRTVFQRVNHVLNLAVCLLCIYQMELGVLFWIVWLMEYLIGIEQITNRPHKAMYQLKVKNQWIQENSKQLIRLDTRAAAEAGKAAYSWMWHLLLAGITAVSGIFLMKQGSWFMEESAGMILGLVSVGVALLFLVMHIWIVENRNIVYSQDSEVNVSVNRLVKRYWSLALISASACNSLAWIYFVWRIWKKDWLENSDYVVYMGLQMLGAAVFLYFIYGIQQKKREILEADPESIYVDDDEFWKDGYYNNPSDRRLLVPGRISSASYTFNMGRTAGRIIYGGILLALVISMGWAAMEMISMLTMKVTFMARTEYGIVDVAELQSAVTADSEEATSGEYVLRFAAADYSCEFTISEISSVQLLEELPNDRFSKINGGATERYNVGHFKGKATGKIMMFLWEGYSPVLEIVLPDKTVFANSKEPGEVELWYEYLMEIR